MAKNRKVKSIQRYTFEIVHYEDGKSTMTRRNENFSVLELMGIASMIQGNLMKTFETVITPCEEKNLTSVNSPLIHTPNK
jgi:hypothetical protein